jgi:hypothetical protein
VLALTAVRSGQDPWRAATYIRWDSVRYLSIATHGYFIHEEDGHVVDGNVAWFPGYPLAIRAWGRLKVTAPRAGRRLAGTAALAVLLVLSTLVLDEAMLPARRALLLLLAAFFPGFVYHHAVFPISMTCAFSLLALALATRQRFFAAGVCGALAAFTYSTGVLVVAALTLAIVLQHGLTVGRRVRAWMLSAGTTLVGYGAALAYQSLYVPWGSFARMQRDYYGAGLHNPLAILGWNLGHLFEGTLGPGFVMSLQTLIVTLTLAGAAILCWRERRSMTRLDVLLLANASLFWLVPQVVGGRVVSVYRAEALLVGLVPLLRHLPMPALIALLGLFLALGVAMSRLFFESVLV